VEKIDRGAVLLRHRLRVGKDFLVGRAIVERHADARVVFRFDRSGNRRRRNRGDFFSP